MISSNLDIKIVIGSWGSYNADNSRAAGSTWLTLSKYTEWEQIEAELKKQGFKLDGIDEELFIQDIEGLPSNSFNSDYMNPKRLFEILMESDVLYDDCKYEILQAFLEIKNFSDFESLVDSYGTNWDDDVHLYKNWDWEQYGRDYYQSCNGEINEDIDRYFDFENYGKDVGYDSAYKYSEGIIEIYE